MGTYGRKDTVEYRNSGHKGKTKIKSIPQKMESRWMTKSVGRIRSTQQASIGGPTHLKNRMKEGKERRHGQFKNGARGDAMEERVLPTTAAFKKTPLD